MADQTPQDLDLTPEIININVQMGTDVTIEFQLTDNSGAPVDITLDSVKFTAKDAFAGTVKIPTKTNGVGQHSSPTTGKTIFVLTRSELVNTPATDEVTWVYEIRRVFAGSGREVIYIHGDLILSPSVGTSA